MSPTLRALPILIVGLVAAADAGAGGTLLVKYREAVDACAETTFARGRAFASVAPGRSLDALHARLEVTEIRSLFMNRAGLDARQAAALWRARMERAAARNPRRAARRGRGVPARLPDLSRVYRLRYAGDLSEEEAARLYAADPLVEYAHPDYPQQLQYVPNDPYFATAGSWGQAFDDLWNLKVIGAPAAWDVTMGEGTVIAIVDTGVDRDHPDIAANIWSNPGEIAGNGIDDDGNGFVDDTWGWDFVGGDKQPLDGHGHGTHVAGIAAAVADNALGILGVAPRAQIMAVRIFAGAEGGTAGPRAIVYAAESGADVINNSWGLRGVPGAGGALDDAVDTALALGAVVVFAGANGDLTLSPVPWWRHPRAISVARVSPPLGTGAFSASEVDLAAPGSRVLSLRAGSGIDGPTVGGGYVVGTGTSMAAPHVAGAAALLLSVLPGLTPREVKWQLEAAAAQVGMGGWEGIPWNPKAGWGRLDLTRAFDPLAITTRLDRYTALERYEFVGQLSEPVRVGHTYTTHDPVAWSAAASPWMQVAPASGVGDGAVDLSIDASGAGAGVHAGHYQLSAPGAADGGAILPVRLYAYPDLGRARRSVLLSQDRLGVSLYFGLSGWAAAASPTHVVVAWHSRQDVATGATVLDPAGSVVGAFGLSAGRSGQYVDAAFDGRHFAVLWIEYDGSRRLLLLSRLAGDGTPLDAGAREIGASSRWWMEPRIAFDGRSYLILWTEVSAGDSGRTSKLLVRRMGTDFAVEQKPRRLYQGDIGGSFRNAGRADLACGRGHCLAVWRDGQPDIDRIRALRLVDGEPAGAPFDVTANSGTFEPQVASSGDDYLVLVAERSVGPCGPTRETGCAKGVLGVRVSGDGQVLDAAPRELITAPAGTPVGVELGRVGFDGAQYAVAYALSNACAARHCQSAVFVTRVATDGTVLDQESPMPALLVDATRDRHAVLPALAATADGITVAWEARRRDPLSGVNTALSLEARPLASHATDVLPALAIGSIGSIVVREGERLAVRLRAPGLSAPRCTFNAEGLPAGAILDAASGVLHWTPLADEAGTYAGIRLLADDGAQQLEETVAIAVVNAISSLSGTVRRDDGTPVAGVAVLLTGKKLKREAITEPDGRFAFYDLVPQRYKVRLAPAAMRGWRARSQKVLLGGPTDDLTGLDLTATPR